MNRFASRAIEAAIDLVKAWDKGRADGPERARLKEAVAHLRPVQIIVEQGRVDSRRWGGGNYLPPLMANKIVECLKIGLSHRQIQREVGAAKNTIARYEALNGPFVCPCGLPRKHRGWCKERLKRSPLRVEFLKNWFEQSIAAGTRRKAKPRILIARSVELSNWPYLRGNDGDTSALIAAVNEVVPFGFPDHMRADICQDLLLAVLEGTATIDDLKSGKAQAIKRYFKLHPGKFGPLSLDQPIPGTDGLRIGDTISNDSVHF